MSKAPLVVACRDHQSRTCIQVDRTPTVVKFIPLDILVGLQVNTLPTKEFDQLYQPMAGYPADKACQLYASYSQNIGASKEALDYLGKVIPITAQEIHMATKRQAAAISQAEVKAATKEPTKAQRAKAVDKAVSEPKVVVKPVTKVPPVKPQVTKTPVTKTAEKSGEKKQTASQMFQDLIMEGKLTDDQIFAKVQDAFGLDEKKRGYVKWYRNHLKKSGSNPPEPK